MLKEVVQYFDLQSENRPRTKSADAGAAAPALPQHAPVLPQYGALALGVLAEPLLRQATIDQALKLDLSSLAGRTVFALLIAIVLLPAVYRNAFDPDKPLLVQLCALFVSGLGWQSLVQGALSAGQRAAQLTGG